MLFINRSNCLLSLLPQKGKKRNTGFLSGPNLGSEIEFVDFDLRKRFKLKMMIVCLFLMFWLVGKMDHWKPQFIGRAHSLDYI